MASETFEAQPVDGLPALSDLTSADKVLLTRGGRAYANPLSDIESQTVDEALLEARDEAVAAAAEATAAEAGITRLYPHGSSFVADGTSSTISLPGIYDDTKLILLTVAGAPQVNVGPEATFSLSNDGTNTILTWLGFDGAGAAAFPKGATVWYNALLQRAVEIGTNGFTSRAAAVVAIGAGWTVTTGTLFSAGEEGYTWQPGATDFADMPNVVSFGSATSAHHGLAGDFLPATQQLSKRPGAPAISGIAPAGWTLGGGVIRDGMALDIRTGGDFSEMQVALDTLSALTFAEDAYCTLRYVAGHVPLTGINVPRGANWGRFIVTATDALVALDGSYTQTKFSQINEDARSPYLDLNVDFAGIIDDGIYSLSNSFLNLGTGRSFINAINNNLRTVGARVEGEPHERGG